MGGVRPAADYFQQAIDKDPNYARAYAGLANTYALMSTWLEGKPDDLMPKARAAALKALQLDESLPEAHVGLALVYVLTYFQSISNVFSERAKLVTSFPSFGFLAELLSQTRSSKKPAF